jgi:hypothetical protein
MGEKPPPQLIKKWIPITFFYQSNNFPRSDWFELSFPVYYKKLKKSPIARVLFFALSEFGMID